MEHKVAAIAFATLGHPDRLAVFRLLMRFAPRGVRPTEIAQALAIKPNTLSHHLADLVSSGLVQVERQGRSLFYSVDRPVTEDLIRYLARDVGRDRPDLMTALTPARTEITPMGNKTYNVLFVCSGNSARSIFAEAILNELGAGKFHAFSAGTHPSAAPNAYALEVLERSGHDVSGLRSKGLAEFQKPGAPVMDFVFTVCDAAAAEECPPWPGQPISGHWGLPDPVKATGTDAEKALVFSQTYGAMRRRISAFVELPFASLDRASLQSRVDAIGAANDTKA